MSTCPLLVFVPDSVSEFGIHVYIEKAMEPHRTNEGRGFLGRFSFLMDSSAIFDCAETESRLPNDVKRELAGRITTSNRLKLDRWHGEALTPDGVWHLTDTYSLSVLCADFPKCWIVYLRTHS